MDSATEDLYLQKIEEFVYDEDKIVTFKWLSIKLDISVNDSKKLLEKYVTDHRSQKPQELAVVYLLTGIDDNNTTIITLVGENELEDKSDMLKKVLSKQIYSVQKCKEIVLSALNLVDYFNMQDPREIPIIGSIRSKNCIKRIFKQKKALPPPPPPTVKGKTSFFTRVPPKSSEKVDAKLKEDSTASNESVVTKEKSNTNVKQNSKDVGATKGKPNGIASFFTKGAFTTVAKPKVEETSEKPKETNSGEEKINNENKTLKSRIHSLVDSDSGSEDIISPTPNPEKQKKRKSIKRQKKENNKSAPSPKRRKRIIEHDSDSDDIFGNDEMDVDEENVNQKSDDDLEPAFKPQLPLPPKNKKRKMVDRTYTDEEGYIITRKEWIEESGSDSEKETSKENNPTKPDNSKAQNKPEEKKPDKTEKENSNEKVVNGKSKGTAKGKKPVAANQQTLMSFFKKK